MNFAFTEHLSDRLPRAGGDSATLLNGAQNIESQSHWIPDYAGATVPVDGTIA
ncbi:MAG: hypothetical protein M3Q96_08215 [Pseudomonadota bacterium]|nr:hypothetical protein [Pseudomonadota bacterium]MDQ3229304.1 hypothetical protein [Pseudomonadota bacterium]